jgi:GNAT superfamily N-acetyltransferase
MKSDEPFERCARQPRPASFKVIPLPPGDPGLAALLRGWDWVARSLLSRGLVPATRARLADSRRIVGELERVLCGEEEGEGPAAERQVYAALHRGQPQAVVSVFLCPRAAFIELLASAPWNLLGEGDPSDARAVRGAARALVGHAALLARASGAGGRVALQAENPRSLEVYQRLGFAPIRPSDAPLGLVPRGEHGWSPPVVRLARGEAGPEEQRSPWLVLDPERLRCRAAVRAVGMAHRRELLPLARALGG